LTIGTLDGANVEILQEVGPENIYIFGLSVDEVEAVHRRGNDPLASYRDDPRIAAVIDAIAGGRFSRGDSTLFQPIIDRLLYQGDEYLHLADFRAYADAQQRAGRDYTDRSAWVRRAIINTARVGFFSSDRTIAEYARDIWHLEAVR
jgi:starch phosphorylase